MEELRITPFGIIFLALGGFTGEEQGKNCKEDAIKIQKMLSVFLQRNNYMIHCKDDELCFIPIQEIEP
jgi:hypothetical protein